MLDCLKEHFPELKADADGYYNLSDLYAMLANPTEVQPPQDWLKEEATKVITDALHRIDPTPCFKVVPDSQDGFEVLADHLVTMVYASRLSEPFRADFLREAMHILTGFASELGGKV